MSDSVQYAKEHKKYFLKKVIGGNTPQRDEKTAILMAGAPGSGKTEVAMSALELIPNLCNIDADRFRAAFPEYTGKNSSQFQRGAAYLVDYTFSWLLEHQYSILLDGTFAIKKSSLNVKRLLDHGYHVFIYYVYQDPFVAWEFTKIREKREGRLVPKERFVNAYYSARENVIQVQKMYDGAVIVDVILKDFDNNIAEYINNVQNIGLVTPDLYDRKRLEEELI